MPWRVCDKCPAHFTSVERLHDHLRESHGQRCRGCSKMFLDARRHQQETGCQSLAEVVCCLCLCSGTPSEDAPPRGNVVQLLFDAFLKQLEFSPRLLQQHEKHAKKMQQQLQRRASGPHSKARFFISGSNARGTALGSSSDLDMIMEIDPSFLSQEPKSVLEGFTDTLRRHQVVCSSRAQRRSIGVHCLCEGSEINIDIVPAVQQGDNYLIPDQASGSWVVSRPSAAKEKLAQAHRNCPSIKALIQLVKCWNKQFAKKRITSFHLEVMCYEFSCPDRAIGRAFADLLVFLADTMTGENPVHTPGLSTLLDNDMPDDSRSVLHQRFTDDAKLAVDACHAEERGDEKRAAELWKRVFPDFPEPGL